MQRTRKRRIHAGHWFIMGNKPILYKEKANAAMLSGMSNPMSLSFSTLLRSTSEPILRQMVGAISLLLQMDSEFKVRLTLAEDTALYLPRMLNRSFDSMRLSSRFGYFSHPKQNLRTEIVSNRKRREIH